MTNREIMRRALHEYTIAPLLAKGFDGKFPHFRRETADHIELISFVISNRGGSFYVEASVMFPNRKHKNYYLVGDQTEKDITVFSTEKRYRLKGMYGGEFFYSDIYRTRIPINRFRFAFVYEGVLSSEKAETYEKLGYQCVKRFDAETALKICDTVNRQMEKAFSWMKKIEKKNQ